MNSTLIQIANNTAAIPIEIVAKTNWTQFTVPLVISSIMTIYVVYLMLKNYAASPMTFVLLRKFKKLTGRHTLLIRHTSTGMFFSDMILRKNIQSLHKYLDKFKGKDFNLILHTPGGDVFATMMLSKILKNYPGKINVYVPDYSMSGGTVLALSGDELHFNKHSCIGPVDPQLGGIFDFGPAAGWKEVMKIKKNKAKDSSIIFNRLGKQVENSIGNYISSLIEGKCKKPKEFAKLLVDGDVEHIYQIDGEMLKRFGFKIRDISESEGKILNKMVYQQSDESVFGI